MVSLPGLLYIRITPGLRLAKLPFTAVAVWPLLLIITSVTLLGNLNLALTTSALNLVPPSIDFISWVVYAVTTPTVLGKSIPFICICSPVINFPEVSLNVISVDPPPAPTANPLAPLFFPLTNDCAGNSAALIFSFKIKSVCVWISNNFNSQVVVGPSYALSSKLNEYTLALPIFCPTRAECTVW